MSRIKWLTTGVCRIVVIYYCHPASFFAPSVAASE